MLSNFDAASIMLCNRNTKDMTYRKKLDLFFIDSDLIPLLIQENYLGAIGPDKDTLRNMSLAADSIAFSDVLN